jgi:NADH:ubiquinone oxidoreductase subunit 5 (subunit L)/multisubunit Na+/H+ antiporter MnhA subunit
VLDWALRVDTLTAVMLVVVNTVSSPRALYSIGYMPTIRTGRASSPICRCSPSPC